MSDFFKERIASDQHLLVTHAILERLLVLKTSLYGRKRSLFLRATHSRSDRGFCARSKGKSMSTKVCKNEWVTTLSRGKNDKGAGFLCNSHQQENKNVAPVTGHKFQSVVGLYKPSKNQLPWTQKPRQVAFLRKQHTGAGGLCWPM